PGARCLKRSAQSVVALQAPHSISTFLLRSILVSAGCVFSSAVPVLADSYFNVDGVIYDNSGVHFDPVECPLNIIGPSYVWGDTLLFYGGCVVTAGPMTVGTTPGVETLVMIEDPGTHLLAESFELVP